MLDVRLISLVYFQCFIEEPVVCVRLTRAYKATYRMGLYEVMLLCRNGFE